MSRSEVELYDATLRDGMGGGGLSLTAAEKVRVVHELDRLGVDVVEAGFPASNPKEAELFARLADERFEHVEIAAFGMTRRAGVPVEEDEGLRVLAGSFAPIVTIVGKASVLHVDEVVRTSRDENVAMVAESVAWLRAQGKRVLLDAEHLFDGWALDRGYALEVLRAAHDAGAERLVLCDTNGGALPLGVAEVVRAIRAELDEAALGIHTHDDTGCAVANALVAVQAGATQVQGTVNGIGERTGNANLVTLIADLQLKLGHDLVTDAQLAHLTTTAHLVDELLNRTPDASQPYVGRHAFAHKAGLHAAGVRHVAEAFEHVDPALVGNRNEVLVSELAGRGTVLEKASSVGLAPDDDAVGAVVERVKALEHAGYAFEAADGSFELLLRRAMGEELSLFTLESWRCIVEQRGDGKVETEATVKVWVDGERYVRTAEGNGPVHALDRALRAAIEERYPHLADIRLENFKVRILDETHGTEAITRVLIDATDGEGSWGTIGVEPNIIAASWQALVDSLVTGMVRARQDAGTPAAARR